VRAIIIDDKDCRSLLESFDLTAHDQCNAGSAGDVPRVLKIQSDLRAVVVAWLKQQGWHERA
jgi:hypothetical protein